MNEDTAKVNVLNLLADWTNDFDSEKALLYAKQSLELAKKINYPKGTGTAYVAEGTCLLSLGKPDEAIGEIDNGIKICHDCGDKFDEAWGYNNIGVIKAQRGMYAEAIENYQAAIKIKQSIGDKRGIARSYINIGGAYATLGNIAEGIKNYQLSLKIRKEIGDKQGMAECYNNIAIIQTNQANYKDALNNYSDALKLYSEVNDQKGAANTYLNIAFNYQRQEQYEEALKNYFTSLGISKETKDNYVIAFTYNNIGAVYSATANYSEAMKNFMASLKLREQIKDEPGISQSHFNIGYMYEKQSNYEEALKNYLSSLKMAEQSGDKNSVAEYSNAVANIYSFQGRRENAIKNYAASLKLYEELGDKYGIAREQDNLGNIYYDQNNYSKALSYHSAALRVRKEIADKEGIAASQINIANVYEDLSNFDEARKSYLEALQVSKECGSKELIMKSYFGISVLDSAESESSKISIDKKAANWKEAYTSYKLYGLYKDSLSDKQSSGHLAELLTKYETEKKEKAILLLQKDQKIHLDELKRQRIIRNFIAGGAGIIIFSSILVFFFYIRKRDADQKQKETSLSLQVSETEMKALRSQMNPHFIFNALQSIQTFLMSHQPDDANMYLLKFSKLMRLVLENSQHGEVPLKDDMQALELYMQLESIRLMHPFTYQLHIDKEIDAEETTIPPLILQPFVENAIWHGLQYKQEPGHIDIYINKKDNALYATVEDNGVGRDQSRKAAQPVFIKKESLGMKLTEERLNILNKLKNIKAHFTITDLFSKNNQPAGTKVELSLPLAG